MMPGRYQYPVPGRVRRRTCAQKFNISFSRAYAEPFNGKTGRVFPSFQKDMKVRCYIRNGKCKMYGRTFGKSIGKGGTLARFHPQPGPVSAVIGTDDGTAHPQGIGIT